jgi:peptidoglycan-associated lipoprotein
MKRRSYLWLGLLIGLTAAAFLTAGCAKKTTLTEQTSGKAPVVAQKEAPPKPMEQPKVVPPAPQAAPMQPPKVEGAPKAEAKPAPLDLNAMRIQFAFDDYSLSIRSRENLDKIAAWMKKDPAVKLQIQGNTCDIGTSEYNLALGDRRALAAKDYVVALGIEASRLATISYGEEKPRVPNSDEANRSLNRRDEFMAQP